MDPLPPTPTLLTQPKSGNSPYQSREQAVNSSGCKCWTHNTLCCLPCFEKGLMDPSAHIYFSHYHGTVEFQQDRNRRQKGWSCQKLLT